MKLVCLGDSLTTGYGVWGNKVWSSNLNDKIRVINKGINGDTTTGMLDRCYEDVILIHPDICLIMGGTNDFLLDCSVGAVLICIKEIVKEVKKNLISPYIGFQPMVIPTLARKFWQDGLDYDGVNNKINLYRTSITLYCMENDIKFIDFYSAFEKANARSSPETYFIDGIHPSEKGHLLMSKEFDRKL
jgi:acyl-CoA thioesterase I